MNLVLNQNKSSWDAMADTWFGSTALPVYGLSLIHIYNGPCHGRGPHYINQHYMS